MFSDFTYKDRRNIEGADESKIGLKAAGLRDLPSSWVPDFAVLVDSEYAEHNGSTEQEVCRFLNKLCGEGVSQVILRSNALDEDIYARGQFKSRRCDASLDSVRETLSRLVQSDTEGRAPRAWILQKYVPPQISGHLSNERRVSWSPREWKCEYETQGPEGSLRRIQVREPASAGAPQLKCGSISSLDEILREVAALSVDRFSEHRSHYEWVWDGFRVWIVQRDKEVPSNSEYPCEEWKTKHQSNNPGSPSFSILVPALDCRRTWPKIECLNTFDTCSIPTADLFVLEDRSEISNLGSQHCSRELKSDLSKLLNNPSVVRTDISSNLDRSGLMLPRTDCVNSLDELLDFLYSSTSHFIDNDIDFDDFIFIFHNFIPSRSAAFAYSRPNHPHVLIDSTWGIPDGLHYFPYDSFIVDSRVHDKQKSLINKKIRCKRKYIDVFADGSWKERDSGPALDWRKSLEPAELQEISQIAKKISNHVGSSVEVMFFVDTPDKTSHPSLLPWYYATDEVPDYFEFETDRTIFSGPRELVKDHSDLDSLERRHQQGEIPDNLSIRLNPTLGNIRDSEFIQRVATLSSQFSIAVELEGSPLSHAYYILQRDGAKVRCIESIEDFNSYDYLNRQSFNKLVRDKIPKKIKQGGESIDVRQEKDARKLLHLLKNKAKEEANELTKSDNNKDTIEELADLYEVMRTIVSLLDVDMEAIQNEAAEKRSARGGFEEGCVLLDTTSGPLLPKRDQGSKESDQVQLHLPFD